MQQSTLAMCSSRFFWRIFSTHVAVIVLCTLGLSFTVFRGYRQIIEDRFQAETEDLSEILAESGRERILGDRELRPTDPFYHIATSRGNRHHLFDADQELVATTVDEESRGEIRLSSLHDQLNADLDVTSRMVGNGERGPYQLTVRRLVENGETIGYLQMEASRAELQSQLQTLSHLVWAIATAVCLIGVALSLIVVSRIIKPVEELTQAAQAIADGRWSQSVSIDSKDELATLAEAFNEMSRELAAHIAELQQQGHQLRENSERLATVLGGMIEGVIAVDSADRILFANDAAFKMIDFVGRRVVGRPYWEVLRNTDVQNVVRDVLADQYQLKREIELPRSQSRVAFIASRLPGEPCPGVVLVLHDVTELRRLERIRSEFVSNVGHELKTPLAAIQACTETLADGAIEDPKHAVHFLSQITDHADRLHKLIIDLMELAKIESEEDAFRLEEIDIGVPIQEAIDEHQSVARARQITIVAKPTIEELLVKADLDGVRTIVNNLLDNALNYTPAGGQAQVAWWADGDEVAITVSDTGVGIEPNHLKRVFERFYRVDSARSRDAGGTGLGLAIVKHLCQFFSGTITVDSELGKGTTFTIRFPLVSTNDSASLPVPSRSSS
ncbi:HAMP domain-containing sensor histidine kinase [Rubinisphaera margarita]|uniref:HAMP domain-containing sensor histidine kinase n=1 Tax=Rubinisphaera margarita TaxID=2909586 RepID=UPI001EE86C6F|nr:ATP-binding protein [Rubinisphaera margarita]MCG6156763.1 cell wall metabolism sensor histidine kinase WalK [Rubinisphaera margarita]